MNKHLTGGQKVVIQAAKSMDVHTWISREEFAERISNETTLSKQTVKTYVSTLRDKIESCSDLETEERVVDQGKPTVYWRSQK